MLIISESQMIEDIGKLLKMIGNMWLQLLVAEIQIRVGGLISY